ncbi:hypothetical protein LP419_01655 [Massilia sp. H-1]|nr:hypothetical protein LP419_01655 [Massilia sp. H-1]
MPELFKRKTLWAVVLLCASLKRRSPASPRFLGWQTVCGGRCLSNAARPRAPDERKTRRPLMERPDALGIASAHAAAFLHCGLDESHYPPADTR